VGIILALAGLDFSNVTEPDYSPGKIRQSADTTSYIEKMVAEVLDKWRRCPQILEANRNNPNLAERERSIFYDTDNILETQKETISVCPDCSGVWSIDSRANPGSRVFAVHVPRKACTACQELGQQWYDETKGSPYDHIFLQDRCNRRYLVKKS
jgi:hypothetical protein